MNTTTRLLKLMLPFHWWIALAVLLSFGALGASVGLMAVSAYLISKAALAPQFADIAVIVTAVRFFAIARAALRYAERYVSHLATFHILTRLRVWFYTAIEPLAPARLQPIHSGDLFTRISADIETLENFYVRVIVPPLAAALVAALASAILGVFDARFAFALLVFLILTGLVLPLLTQRLSRAPTEHLIRTRAELNAVLTDELQGIADVMAFGQAETFRVRVRRLNDALERAQLRLANARGMANALAVLFAALAGLTILMLAIPLVSGGQIDGVFLALLPLTVIACFEAVQPLGAAFQHLEASRAAAKRLFELIDAPPLVQESAQQIEMPRNYSIEFHGVSFRYAPEQELVLDDVHFRIREGERVAVIGASGAGKSTLVNLLVRFWDTQAGQVCVGGNDVRAYRTDDLRKRIGVALQHPYLFNGTLRDNLLLAKGDATAQELDTACRVAQLGELLTSLPLGYDTLVGENGLKLSGGEQQRLAIARVILKNAPIVILDEATANLDALTEQKLINSLEPFLRGRTVLIISHRRAGFQNVNRVLTLERGRFKPEAAERANDLRVVLSVA